MLIYLAQQEDALVKRSFEELRRLGAVVMYDGDLLPNVVTERSLCIALFVGEKTAHYPSRFLREVTERVRTIREFPVPTWALEKAARHVALRPQQLERGSANDRHFAEAILQMHYKLSGMRIGRSKRRRRPSGWHARHGCGSWML